MSGVTGRIDTSLFTRVVKRFTYLALRTKNIHQQCVSFSRTNYTWSDRNICAGLLLGFVLKRSVTIWWHLSFTRDVLQRRFSAQHSDNYDAKMPSFTFSGSLKQARTKSSLILILNMVPGIQVKECLLKWVSRNDRDEDWKNAKSIFKRGFRFPRRPRILRSLKLERSLCNEQNNNSARALHFLVHFLVVSARLPREICWFDVLLGR